MNPITNKKLIEELGGGGGGGSFVMSNVAVTEPASLYNKTTETSTEVAITSRLRKYDNGSEIIFSGFMTCNQSVSAANHELTMIHDGLDIEGLYNIECMLSQTDEDGFVSKKIDSGICRVNNNSINIFFNSASTGTLNRIDFAGSIPKI